MSEQQKLAALLDAAKEAREAIAAAMRVITEIDTGSLLRMSPATRQQAFIDELHMAGVKDGFGVRLQDAIAAFDPAYRKAVQKATKKAAKQ